ncbi:hypothetical protein AAHD62_11985 [Enterobacter hormaechei]
MDIEITSPVNIMLDVVELDEHIPSMKFNITIRVRKFNFTSEAQSQLWIECRCFDQFIEIMQKGETAVFKDMNGFFELRVDSIECCLGWSCAREDLEGNVASSQGKEKLTQQTMHMLYDAFNNYPRWW